MVSRLWFTMSGFASTTMRSACSLPLKSGINTSTDVPGRRRRISAIAARTSRRRRRQVVRSTLVMTTC